MICSCRLGGSCGDGEQLGQQFFAVLGVELHQAQVQAALAQVAFGLLRQAGQVFLLELARNPQADEGRFQHGIDQESQQFQRSFIGPVQVLKNQHQGREAGFGGEHLAHRQEDALAQLGGVQVARALGHLGPVQADAQHGVDEGQGLGGFGAQQAGQVVFDGGHCQRLGRILLQAKQGAQQVLEDPVGHHAAVGVALADQHAQRHGFQVGAQLGGQAALADAGFALDQRVLALAKLDQAVGEGAQALAARSRAR